MAKIFFYGTSGSDDPTRAGMPLMQALGAKAAGLEAEVALLGEATYLMKDVILKSVLPVGFPPAEELMGKVVAQGIPIYV